MSSIFGDGIKNAVIESAKIGIERGFALDCFLTLDYGGVHQGFGGWMLSHTDRKEPDAAGTYICEVLKIAGVEDWAKLPGKTIRVDVKNGLVKGIGHIVKDEWFYPEKMFAEVLGVTK